MTFVFEDETGSVVEIQEAFYQQLLVKLTNAYTVKAGVQYSAKVEAGDFKLSGSAATPALYGNIQKNFRFLGGAIDPNNPTILYLYFSEPLDKTEAEAIKNYTVSALTVNSATLSSDNWVVTLTLSDEALVNQTTVAIADSLTSLTGQQLLPPLSQTIENAVDVSHRTGNISLTSAKLNLKNSDAVPLPFLVSAPQLVRNKSGAIISYLDLDTTYGGNEIEHQISTLPNIADYRASSWLNFLNRSSLLNRDLGATKVPLMLRSFPASPRMVQQQGEASEKTISDSNISQILQWNYKIHYAQTVHYPQDELNFTVNFNVYEESAELAAFEDAFNPLAQFITVYPAVEAVLRDKLLKINAMTNNPEDFQAAAIALDAFNAMVSRIVAASEDNGFRFAELTNLHRSNAAEPYYFSVKEGSATVDREKDALVITLIGSPPLGIGNPTVTIPGYTTKIYTGTCNGDFCFYFVDAQSNPLKAEAGQRIAPRILTLPRMNILARQDVETTVALQRNADLLAGKTTASDFIYTTGNVGFVDLYHPLIHHSSTVNIAAIVSGVSQNTTLRQHLTNLFNQLLKENSQNSLSFLMTNTYSYQSNNSDLDGISLPVMMQPLQNFTVKDGAISNDNKTLVEMIEGWSGSILNWFSIHQTQKQGGILNFDLTIFSNLTQQPLPLLRLNSLSLALKNITDLV